MIRRPTVLLSLALAALTAGCGEEPVKPAYPGPAYVAAAPLAPNGAALNELIPDLELTDIEGRTSRLSELVGERGLLIAMRDTDCPVAKKYGPRLARLEAEHAPAGLPILFVNPTRQNSAEGIRQEIAAFGFRGRYVHEPEAPLARALAARTSAEVFLLDSRRTLIYRGAIDDQYGIGFTREAPRHTYLADALEDYLADRAVRVPATSAPGCELGLETPPAPPAERVTYYNQVSRIVQDRCLECHRTDGVAPFPLATYKDVAGRKATIRRVILEGQMPPWFAAPGGERWANDPSLSEQEKQTLFRWLDEGAPAGDPEDAPLPRRFDAGWGIGTPDLVLELPEPQQVPAEGLIPYRYGVVDVDFPEDVWVQAAQIRPTANANVHHVLVFIERRDLSPFEKLRERLTHDQAIRRGLETHFAAYAPGSDRMVYPPGTAKRLPRKTRLVFQMHYVTTGVRAEDRTRMGLVFAPRPPRYEVFTASAHNRDFEIPPGAPNYEVSGEYEFAQAGEILSFGPHMHLRGKAFRYDLADPEGNERSLLTIPRYGFHWQLTYELATPIPVSPGHRLIATGWFDNGADNPANPDPTKTVAFGVQSTDEMMIGYFDWIPSTPLDLSTARP